MKLQGDSLFSPRKRARFSAVRALPLAGALGVALWSASAGAQSPPAAVPAAPAPAQDSAAARAEALFDEGVTLLEAKSFAAACAKLEESQRLDPAPGTVSNIAICEEGQGHFAAAARRWREALSLLPKDDSRRADAEKSAVQAEARAGKVRMRPSPQAPAEMKVTVDERAIGEEEMRTGVLLDPGAHRVAVTAPGREPRELTVTTAAGQETEVVLTPGPALPVAPSAPPPQGPVAPPPKGVEYEGFFSQHKVSFGLLGAGAALAIAGGAVGANLISGPYSDFVQSCGAEAPDCAERKAGIEGRAIAINTLVGLGAAAGVAAGVVFFAVEGGLSARPKSATTARIALGPAGVTLTLRR